MEGPIMRRYIALIIALLLAACSGDGAATTTAAPSSDNQTATSAEQATTTEAAPITTTTTTAAPEESNSFAEFPTAVGTPPDVFASFVADMTMTMGLDDLSIDVAAEGVWTEKAFSCTVTSGLGGLSFSESIVATPEQLWLDAGNGYEETDLFATSAQEIMSSCPTSTLFWASFSTEDMGDIGGNEEVINGRTAIRADLADLMKGLGGLGMISGFEGAEINELTVWVDVETNTVLAMVADLAMSEDLMGEFGAAGTGPVSLVMNFEISQINDPDLVVELP